MKADRPLDSRNSLSTRIPPPPISLMLQSATSTDAANHALERLAEGASAASAARAWGAFPYAACARHASAGDRGALTISILLRLRHRLPMLGAIRDHAVASDVYLP